MAENGQRRDNVNGARHQETEKRKDLREEIPDKGKVIIVFF